MVRGTVYIVSLSRLRSIPRRIDAARVLPEGILVMEAADIDAGEAEVPVLQAALRAGEDAVVLGDPERPVETWGGGACVVRLDADALMHHWGDVGLDLQALDTLTDDLFSDDAATGHPDDRDSVDLRTLSIVDRLSTLSMARWWKAERLRF